MAKNLPSRGCGCLRKVREPVSHHRHVTAETLSHFALLPSPRVLVACGRRALALATKSFRSIRLAAATGVGSIPSC